jgi:hypothetical protein
MNPDFYLSSSEGYGLEQPRACFRIKRLKGRTGDDYLAIRVEPPIPGQPYGLGNRDIDTVVVAARHAGTSLFPITDWPAYVHVARPLGANLETRESLQEGELEEIGWAELHPDRRAAEQKTG